MYMCTCAFILFCPHVHVTGIALLNSLIAIVHYFLVIIFRCVGDFHHLSAKVVAFSLLVKVTNRRNVFNAIVAAVPRVRCHNDTTSIYPLKMIFAGTG